MLIELNGAFSIQLGAKLIRRNENILGLDAIVLVAKIIIQGTFKRRAQSYQYSQTASFGCRINFQKRDKSGGIMPQGCRPVQLRGYCPS